MPMSIHPVESSEMTVMNNGNAAMDDNLHEKQPTSGSSSTATSLTVEDTETELEEGKLASSTADSNASSDLGAWDPMWAVEQTQLAIYRFVEENRPLLRAALWLGLLLFFHIFIVLALLHDFHRALNLAVFTAVCWLFLLYKRVIWPLLRKRKAANIARHKKGQPSRNGLIHSLWNNRWAIRLFYLLGVALPLAFVFWDCHGSPHRLSGLSGLAFFFIFMCLCSHKPTKVHWRPVLWGFLLQFIFGLLVLRWEWGANRFVELSDVVITFLDFTNNGTDFAYGFLSSPPNICGMEPVLAFKTLQVIIYVGALVSVLYFYGIIQAVLKRTAWLMQLTMGTTATESLNACACVLLGNAESPMLIRPYIQKMTASELHAIMTTGFACIAGAVFATFISFGVCPRYLLSAAVMSAPGSLACSKLMYPESEESNTKDIADLELPPSKEKNAMECVSAGSLVSVHVITAVLANLISFVALLALISGVVGYAGSLLGFEGLSLELLFGYAFMPVAYLVGVTDGLDQALIVGRLLGVKIAISDFIAYKRLGDVLHLLTPRSAMIATYALCSFSNFIAAGVQMAVLSEMAPSKKALISKLVMRALLAGCISCFMSASIAGILIEDPIHCKLAGSGGGHCFNLEVHQSFMEQMLRWNVSQFAAGAGGNGTLLLDAVNSSSRQ